MDGKVDLFRTTVKKAGGSAAGTDRRAGSARRIRQDHGGEPRPGGRGHRRVVYRRGASAGHQLLLVHPAAVRRGRAGGAAHRGTGLSEPQQRRAGGPGADGAAGGKAADADL